ncbi:magnesium chelatase subunit D [Hydrogenophaga sp. IBVHS2]|uniref:magnesium chelatase subunit D n=1 Tax=Hydrogenophaga sp. IBVHS2 TaxID=1985170 RepID=UPI000A2E1952|nr:magnesium chelatase subunit D [Hydrogenophaga sp. IBVHS2]OSZ67706.1 hypothetical protein CAP38_02800 [Hydrogenophaga sp. IBVHS2]
MTLTERPAIGADAALAAALLAVDPVGLGGIHLQGPAGPSRDAWLALLRRLMPAGSPWQRLPLHAGEAALLGGLDLAATLQAARPVVQPGLLARADGGTVLLTSAERTPALTASLLASVLDHGEIRLQRDGLSQRQSARWLLVALDESIPDADTTEATVPAALTERLALQLDLRTAASTDPTDDASADWTPADVTAARQRLASVQLPDDCLQALCATALVWGVPSLRAPLMAVRLARAAAALDGSAAVGQAHAEIAARLALAHRATRLPPDDAQNEAPPEDPPAPPDHPPPDDPDREPDTPSPETPRDPLQDRLVEAVRAVLPPGLLAALQAGLLTAQPASRGAGQAGAVLRNAPRGRPVGTRRGDPRRGQRLHVLDTLRAAAPWQTLRRPPGEPQRLRVRRDDFHVVRHRQHRPVTNVFVVDASGSAALHRLAEAKGAVELLLADCYVRRDRVAVLAFRGQQAEVLLPPTRSLTRARRELAALPGGGGTPLAAAIESAHALALQLRRTGDTPVLVFLTDGRANIARDGAPGRTQAQADALTQAAQLRAAGLTTLLIDTSPQPADAARAVAEGMGARYVPLPHAGAAGLSAVVRAVQPDA